MNKSIAFIIGICLIISANIIGSYFFNARKSVNTIKVVGYASNEYDSDILKWQISLSTTADIKNLANGYATLNKDIQSVKDFLASKNLNTNDIQINSAYSYPNYNRDGEITNYTFEQSIAYTSNDSTNFKLIEEIAYNFTELAKKGINIRNSNVEYFISALPELKKEIISEATKDARERALQVANTTKTKLGKLINGRVGVFQITAPLSTEVQSYGIYNTSTRRKQISVTMTGVFELK